MNKKKRFSIAAMAAVLIISAFVLTTTSCSLLGDSGDKTAAISGFISDLNTSGRTFIADNFTSGTNYSPSAFISEPWNPDNRDFSMESSTLVESGSLVSVDITNNIGTFTATFTMQDEGDDGLFGGSDWKIYSVSAGSYHVD